MSINVSGQVALVTGASRGIGASIALTLAEQGYKVIGTATTDDGAAKISAALAAFAGCSGKNLNVNDATAKNTAVCRCW
jgi:3-oxoacyl-[acyl-carrier protein] reductase